MEDMECEKKSQLVGCYISALKMRKKTHGKEFIQYAKNAITIARFIENVCKRKTLLKIKRLNNDCIWFEWPL